MAKVNHVKKARVDCKDRNGMKIRKGQEYWWWQFPFEERTKSITKPTRSELVQSKYKKKLYEIEDELDRGKMAFSGNTLKNFNKMIMTRILIFRKELEQRLENMPSHLRHTTNGKLIQKRIEYLTKWAEKL